MEESFKKHLLILANSEERAGNIRDQGSVYSWAVICVFFPFKKCWRVPTYLFKLTACDLDDEIQSVPKQKLPRH